jgi:glycosyltransferase involved in cell wall biosynthesis
MLATNPRLDLVAARRTPAGVAALLAEHDVVVMPSNGQYWHETFGILAIEAQHAGCRVVASDDGGLPETDCGALALVAPDDAEALARGILAAQLLGPVPTHLRQQAAQAFTVSDSVDSLLDVLRATPAATPWTVLRDLETLAALPSLAPPHELSSADDLPMGV